MERTTIIERLKTIKTTKDLAALLDEIKQDEFGSVRYSISEKMLRHFSSDAIAPKRFRTFHIHKKSGGLREIKAPCRQLDVILTCINLLLRAIYEPSEVAMGFTSGRSVLNNAQVHVGHNYVFNIDLKDFFPSISQARVWKRLQLAPFNFSQEIANVLAGLCCSYDQTTKRNVLPQGSPASPLLTNAICDKLDRRMKGVAKRFGLHYSRYADDMTFSSMHNVYQNGSEFQTEIQRIIDEQGFQMNDSKTRLQKVGTRQEVTGLTVNSIANVSRKYISDLRWILHVWEKEGYAKAYALFYPKYKHEKGYIKKGEPVMENVIGGKLNYLRMVRGANNPAYQKLASRYAALQELVFVDNETDKAKSYVYVQPYTLADFQSLFHTIISLEISRDRKVVGKCVIDNREKFLAVSKSTQKVLCPDLDGKSAGDTIQSEDLAKCFVTLCRNRGKNFWLITKFEPKRSRCLSIQNLKVTPEDLLTLWTKKGLEGATEKLNLFIQYGQPEKSILNWNPSRDSKDVSGEIKFGEKDLLWYFLKKRNLTTSNKNQLIRLLTQKDKFSSTNSKQHSPQKMIEFLSLFSRDEYFKWYTHPWDQDGQSLESLINQQKKKMQELSKKFFELINSRTYYQVNHFINFTPDPNNKNSFWYDNNGQKYQKGWHSIVDIHKKQPETAIWNLILPDDGHQFRDYIRLFKTSIEFRTDLGMDSRFNRFIKNSIKYFINGAVNISYSDDFTNIGKDINIYCDIPGLHEALGIICNWIVDHKVNGPNVKVDIVPLEDSYELVILHENSYFSNLNKLASSSGDLDKLRNRLFSVCDLTLSGDYVHNGESKNSVTVHVLEDKTTKENKVFCPCRIEYIDRHVGGVEYTLKFYR